MTPMAAAEFMLVPPPPGGIFRVARGPDPFLWRDPKPAQDEDDDSDGILLAGNRFDAPAGEWRTLYAAESPYGCMLEKLAAFRATDERFEERVADATSDDAPDTEFDVPIMRGKVPADLFDAREAAGPGHTPSLVLGHANLSQEALLVDIEHRQTVAALNQLIDRSLLRDFGLDRIDRGTVTSRDRRLTRALAAEVRRLSDRGATPIGAGPQAIGIRYDSVHGQGVACFALWEAAVPFMRDHGVAPIDFTSAAVREAAGTLGLALPPLPAKAIDPLSW